MVQTAISRSDTRNFQYDWCSSLQKIGSLHCQHSEQFDCSQLSKVYFFNSLELCSIRHGLFYQRPGLSRECLMDFISIIFMFLSVIIILNYFITSSWVLLHLNSCSTYASMLDASFYRTINFNIILICTAVQQYANRCTCMYITWKKKKKKDKTLLQVEVA